MSKTISGNIWRLDKGIKRIEKKMAELDAGIAQLKRHTIDEDQRDLILAKVQDVEITTQLELSAIRRSLIKSRVYFITVPSILFALVIAFFLL